MQRFPLGSGIPGFPYCTNELALLSALWNCPLSLSGLTVVDLGLVPLSLLWSGSSPSVDTKEVPRLNEFWLYRLLEGSRHPPGNLLTARRSGSLGKPPASAHLRQRGPYHTNVRPGFQSFPA